MKLFTTDKFNINPFYNKAVMFFTTVITTNYQFINYQI